MVRAPGIGENTGTAIIGAVETGAVEAPLEDTTVWPEGVVVVEEGVVVVEVVAVDAGAINHS